MSKTRKKKSQSKKAIEAALAIARQHAELIEAAERSTDREQAAHFSAPPAVSK